ncbi:MAG TPA: apolipoprotein N-acyltransferase [Quisquiliibacterium sp.]|nr:apolipoprotein N-acyltransferase [Quisquiliibacterium sp.]
MSPGARLPERLRLPAAALLGALHALGFAPPLDHWLVPTVALALLLRLTGHVDRDAPIRHTLLPGLCFGLGWFTVGLSWLHTSMHVYGGMPWPLAAAAVVLFAAYLALFPAAALAAARRLAGPDRAVLAHAALLAAAWGGAELLRGWLFTGFPWLAVGYAHVDGPLAGYAPLVGVHGIGMLAVLLAALWAAAPAHWRLALPVTVLVLACGAALRTQPFGVPQGDAVRVRLVQGNVPQQMKFDRVRALQAMEDYAALAEGGDAQLTVLPETAWTTPWSSTPPDIAARLLRTARPDGHALAIGMPLFEASGPDPMGLPSPGAALRYTNSVALILPPSPAIAARYDKQHLVPFGEFIPTGFAWFVRLMNIPLGEFARGRADQPPFTVAGQRFAFDVCYEDLFGDEIARTVRGADGAAGASVLVNVSNIAWFGDSHALPQHLAIARMRALETARPMLRATNTGVTAAIDHRGRVTARLPAYERGALDVQVQGTTGTTPYVRFGTLAPGALLLALLLAGLAVRRRGTGSRRHAHR